MRKLIQYILLVLGIVTLIYSVAEPWKYAADNCNYSPIAPPGYSWWTLFMANWSTHYQIMTYLGSGMILLTVLLLVIFRKNNSCIGTAPVIMISNGALLELIAFLQAWTYAVNDDSVYLPEPWMSTFVELPFEGSLMKGLLDGLWMALLGLVLIIAGVVAWLKEQRKIKEEPVTEVVETEAPEIVEELPVVLEREEWRITLLCTVMDIRGDYALVKYDDSSVESEVAIALLPFGIDVGDKLKYENYEFERA